jgi:hypothetical protein
MTSQKVVSVATFDQTHAKAIDALRTSKGFLLFVIRPDGRASADWGGEASVFPDLAWWAAETLKEIAGDPEP